MHEPILAGTVIAPGNPTDGTACAWRVPSRDATPSIIARSCPWHDRQAAEGRGWSARVGHPRRVA